MFVRIRLQGLHGASCPSSNEIPVVLDLLEFSDCQLVQALVEANGIVIFAS